MKPTPELPGIVAKNYRLVVAGIELILGEEHILNKPFAVALA